MKWNTMSLRTTRFLDHLYFVICNSPLKSVLVGALWQGMDYVLWKKFFLWMHFYTFEAWAESLKRDLLEELFFDFCPAYLAELYQNY